MSATQGAGVVTIAPTKCNPPKVESSDGAKSPPKSCPTITIPIPLASYRAKQQQYLATLAKQQASWKSLSKDQQALEQLKLKRSILGQ